MIKKLRRTLVAAAIWAVVATGSAWAEGSVRFSVANVYCNATDKANGVAYFLTTDMASLDSWADHNSFAEFMKALEDKTSVAVNNGATGSRTLPNTALGLADNTSVTCYLLIFNSSEITENSKYYITSTKTITTGSTGAVNVAFGSQTNASHNDANWHDMPAAAAVGPTAYRVGLTSIAATAGLDKPSISNVSVSTVELLSGGNVVGSANLNANKGRVDIVATSTPDQIRFYFSWYNTADEASYDGALVASVSSTSGVSEFRDEGELMLQITARYTFAVAPPTYSVTLAEGTEDPASWSINPATAEKDQTVTLQYNGTRRIAGIRAALKE